MAYSKVSYIGDGYTNMFGIPFEYLSINDISVFIDDVEDQNITFISNSLIKTSIVPPHKAIVLIKRNTIKERVVDFQNGSMLNEATLDLNSNQLVYIMQELLDEHIDTLQVNTLDQWDARDRPIVNLSSPSDIHDAATKAYVDAVAGQASYVLMDGGSFVNNEYAVYFNGGTFI